MSSLTSYLGGSYDRIPAILAVTILLPLVAGAQSINPTEGGAEDMVSPAGGAFSNEGFISPLQTGGNAGGFLLDDSVNSLSPTPDGTFADEDLAMDLVAGETPADGKTVVETKRWRLRPILGAGVVYDDNIFISKYDRQGDVIFTVTGGLAFELGDYRNLKENYLLAEYSATGFFYAEHSDQNAANQNAALRGQYRFNKLTAQLESQYQYLTGADRDVGNFANRHVFNNGLRFIYDYSDKTKADLELRQLTNLYQNYLNSYEYIAKFGIDYLITPKISLGLEGRVGGLDVEESPFQIYEQARIRGRYELTGKIALKASGGVEIRQYVSGGQGVSATPVFSFGAEYRPFVNSFIGVEAYRNVSGSASLAGQNFIATGVQLSLRQLFFQKMSLGLATGYENDTYTANEADVSADRVDNFVFFRPNISYAVFGWLNTGIFYEYRQNFSDTDSNSFYNNRVGFEVTAQF